MRPFKTRRGFVSSGMALVGMLASGSALSQSVSRSVPRVAGLFTAPVDEQWTSRVHRAALMSSNRRDIEYDLWQRVSQQDYRQVFHEVSRQNYDLVIGDCFSIEDLVRDLILEYPERSYLMGSARKPETQHERFCVFEHHIQDASYLSGLVAGAITETGIIGLVGGYPSADTNRLMNAFIAGATEINQQLGTLVGFIDSWYAPSEAARLAASQVDAGADVLYAERAGVAETARRLNVRSIGSLIDQTGLFPGSMVTAAVWHFDPTLWAALEMTRSGEFRTADMGVYSNLAFHGCELAPLRHFTDLLSPDQLEHIARREFEIRNGKFRVPGIESQPVSTLQTTDQA